MNHCRGKRYTYFLCHLVLNADVLGLEEVLERLLLLAVHISNIFPKKDRSEYLPVDVAELVFAQTTLQTDSDVKCAAGGDSASDTRHRNNRDVLHLNVSRGLGDEHKALIQEVQETLVGLDGTLDAMVTMVAVDGLVLGVINVATGLY